MICGMLEKVFPFSVSIRDWSLEKWWGGGRKKSEKKFERRELQRVRNGKKRPVINKWHQKILVQAKTAPPPFSNGLYVTAHAHQVSSCSHCDCHNSPESHPQTLTAKLRFGFRSQTETTAKMLSVLQGTNPTHVWRVESMFGKFFWNETWNAVSSVSGSRKTDTNLNYAASVG